MSKIFTSTIISLPPAYDRVITGAIEPLLAVKTRQTRGNEFFTNEVAIFSSPNPKLIGTSLNPNNGANHHQKGKYPVTWSQPT